MNNLSGKYLKCGEMYIKFDDYGEPDYGFEVNGYRIIQFKDLKNDRVLKEIILPPINQISKGGETPINGEDLEILGKENDLDTLEKYYFPIIEHYLRGHVYIQENCFEQLKNITIIATSDYSISFKNGAFFECENISFVLPKNQTLYSVHECHNGWFDYEHNDWNLIGHKSLPVTRFDELTITANDKYEFTNADYDDEDTQKNNNTF